MPTRTSATPHASNNFSGARTHALFLTWRTPQPLPQSIRSIREPSLHSGRVRIELRLVLRREGAGESTKLTVSFPGYGQKKLVEKYAGLEKA